MRCPLSLSKIKPIATHATYQFACVRRRMAKLLTTAQASKDGLPGMPPPSPSRPTCPALTRIHRHRSIQMRWISSPASAEGSVPAEQRSGSIAKSQCESTQRQAPRIAPMTTKETIRYPALIAM